MAPTTHPPRSYDSRGRDITSEVNACSAAWKIVECSSKENGQVPEQGLQQQQQPYSGGVIRAEPSGRGVDQKLQADAGVRSQEEETSRQERMSREKQGSNRVTAMAAPAPPQLDQRGAGTGAVGDDPLAAAMRAMGLSHLPPPARPLDGRPPSASAAAIDMRLRPRSGGMGRGAGRGPSSSGDGDRDLEDDFEARLQRNIDMGLPSGSGATARPAPGAAPSSSSASRPATLAPLPQRRPGGDMTSAKAARPRSAASEAQQGYGDGEDDLDARVQRQIDCQMGGGGGSGVLGAKGSRSTLPLLSSGSPGREANPAVRLSGKAPDPMGPKAASPSHARKSAAAATVTSGTAKAAARSSQPNMHANGAKPSSQQLRSMQAAWDAL